MGIRISLIESSNTLYSPVDMMCSPRPVEPAADADDNDGPPGELTGTGVCAGEVTGTARVVVDPDEADSCDGDVLVCPTPIQAGHRVHAIITVDVAAGRGIIDDVREPAVG